MSEVELKHYSKYLQILQNLCKGLRLKIVHKSYIHEGAYVPARRKIIIDSDLSPSSEISTILHELGHVLDMMLTSTKRWNRAEAAYSRYFDKKATRQDKSIVVETEKRAWDYGRYVANFLGIRLGKWYDEDEDESIVTYLNYDKESK